MDFSFPKFTNHHNIWRVSNIQPPVHVLFFLFQISINLVLFTIRLTSTVQQAIYNNKFLSEQKRGNQLFI